MANAITNVGFGAGEYGAEAADIERRRAYAQALQQQGAQPIGPTEMAGGWAVRKSPLEGLAKMLQAYGGRKGQEAATEEQKALGQRYQSELARTLMQAQQAGAGSPAVPSTMYEDAAGNAGPTDARAAVAPDRQAMARILMGHPATQSVGMAQMMKEPKWEKADIRQPDGSVKKGYVDMNSPNPEATFRPLGTEPVKQEFVANQPVNPYTRTTPVADPNQLMSVGPNGPVLNQPLLQAKKDIAAKGAANVSVKTDVKTGESLAGQVGPMMRDSTAIAEGAVKQIDAARRIVQAVDAGKIITGPTADARLAAAQIGQALGVGGKDDAEKIANTRQALRGLAELTLQGRQQMKGQGAITESEGKLAEKAMSGEISFTAAEIKQLAKASERAAQFNIAEHRRKLKVMQDNPALQGIAPFYQGPALPPDAGAPAVQVSPATRAFLQNLGISTD